MYTLAIDGSSNLIDFSIFNKENELLYCHCFLPKEPFSKILIDLVDNALNEINIKLEDITQLFAVAGPGRYTSIRVVISTLKGLFFKKPPQTYRVNELDLTAALIDKDRFRVAGELFSSYGYFCDYEKKDGRLIRISSITKAKQDEIIDTKLELFYTTDKTLLPKTPFVFKIKDLAEEVELLDLNPFY
ncbi:hypothetical protein [Hippea jasoniae]|uniref:hypothetical protein n=1 Tax=Hippea jasoniae TaxID=944479 RepID=UPI00054D8F97|nr:hypothetical protein [Hippea jasoniae]